MAKNVVQESGVRPARASLAVFFILTGLTPLS